MSILDTITSLNQEASVRASTDKAGRGQASEDSMLLDDKGVEDMSVDEEGDDHRDGKTPEDGEELAPEGQAPEVKTENVQEQLDLGKERLAEEVKCEEEEPSAQEPMEEEKDKVSGKATGEPAEEKQEDELLKCSSQAKQKVRERIKEGEQLGRLCSQFQRRITSSGLVYDSEWDCVDSLMIHIRSHLSLLSNSSLEPA